MNMEQTIYKAVKTMKEVLISIKPKWCELIANGAKIVEVRKTKPNLETPFKCYIYCTKSELLTKSHYNGNIYVASSKKYQNALECNGNITLSGKVIGEFVCDYIYENMSYDCEGSFVSASKLQKYANGKTLYGWHISDLKIYDKPKELSEFKKINRECLYADLGLTKRDCPECKNESCFMSRPPQSWCYVEEEK